MTRIALARIAEHADSVRELFAANWAETGFDFPLEPDIAQYQALQDAGALFALAAWHGADIVGYSSAFVQPSLFNPAVVCCASDALFVHPSFRAGTLGARLIVATEDEARRRGASRMLWHTRAGTPLARAMLRRGYQPADTVVMKEI